jgi:hypothetical protein
VQNSNPNPFQTRNPDFSATLDQAFARAMARLADIAPPPASPGAPADAAAPEAPAVAPPLVTGAELFGVLREPIEDLLSLAHQLASTDPVDLAAVQRVNAALLTRWSGQPAGLRARDVLIVLGLLVRVVDPATVIRAVSNTLSQGIATVLGSDSPVSFYVARIPESVRRPSPHGSTSHACCHLHANRAR